MTEERAKFLLCSLQYKASVCAREGDWRGFYKSCWTHDTLMLAVLHGGELPDYDENGFYIEKIVFPHIAAPSRRMQEPA